MGAVLATALLSFLPLCVRRSGWPYTQLATAWLALIALWGKQKGGEGLQPLGQASESCLQGVAVSGHGVCGPFNLPTPHETLLVPGMGNTPGLLCHEACVTCKCLRRLMSAGSGQPAWEPRRHHTHLLLSWRLLLC